MKRLINNLKRLAPLFLMMLLVVVTIQMRGVWALVGTQTSDEVDVIEIVKEELGYVGIEPFALIHIPTIPVSEMNGASLTAPNPAHFNAPPIFTQQVSNLGTRNSFSVEYTPPEGWFIYQWQLTFVVSNWQGITVDGSTGFRYNLPPGVNRYEGGIFGHAIGGMVNDYDWYFWAPPPTFHFRLHPIPPTIEKTSVVTSGEIPVYNGDIITFTISVRNPATGQGSFNNFFFDDHVPAGLAPIDGTLSVFPAVADGGASISGNRVSGVLNLPPANDKETGGVVTITFQAEVTDRELAEATGGEFINTVHLYNPERERISTSMSEGIPVADPEVTIEKGVNADEVYAGDDLTYTLIVRNTGNVPLYNAVVTDPLMYVFPYLDSDGTEIVTIEFSDGRTPMMIHLAQLILGYNIGTLGISEYATLTFTVRVANDAYGGTVLDNTAIASGTSYDDEEVNASDSAITRVNSEPEIEILKSVNTDEVFAGDVLTYMLIMTNTGNVTLHDVIVIDPLTAMLSHLDSNGTETVTIVFSDGRMPITTTLFDLIAGYNIGTLGVTEYATLVFTVMIDADIYACTVLMNTATAIGIYEGYQVNASDSATTHAISEPSISIAKAADQEEVYAGYDLTYTLVVTNTGNITLNNVTVRDPMINMIAYLNLAGTEEVAVVFSDDRAPLTFHLMQLMLGFGHNIGTLGVDEYATLTFTVTVDADVYGGTVLNNTATVTGVPTSIASCDVGPAVSDADSASVRVISEPDISIVKSVGEAEVYAGDDLTYTLVVTNTGNVTLHNVIVTDSLTAVLPYLSSGGTVPVTIVFSGDRTPITITLAELMSGYNIGTLGVSEYATLMFSVTVDATVYDGTVLHNTATVSGIYDGLSIEDDASATTTVVRREAIPRYILRELIAEAEARVQANYTPRSWADMQSMLTFARSVYNNPNLQGVQYDEAVILLRARLDALVLR